MKQITIKDDLGTEYPGTLPEGWNEVPVQTFISYQEFLAGGDVSKTRYITLIAHLLTGLPLDLLEQDVSWPALIVGECRFFLDTLPVPVPVEVITHQGREFVYAGGMQKLSAGQFEALLAYIDQADGKPLAMLHWLLSVLYAERGVPQTAETVAANAELFLTLPMDMAYGAVGFFLTSSHDSVLRILKFSELKENALGRIANLESHLQKNYSTARGALRRKYFGWLISKLEGLKKSAKEI